MSTYLLSSLVDGATIDYDAREDAFAFDLPSVSAAAVRFEWGPTFDSLAFAAAGKSFTLQGVADFTFDSFSFTDGSRLLASNLGNGFSDTLTGTNRDDALIGRAQWAGDLLRLSNAPSGQAANGESVGPLLSADGRVVVFISTAADLTSDDTNATEDAFVHDLALGVTTRATTRSDGGEFNAGGSTVVDVSADGRHIVFLSDATNVIDGDTNLQRDVFVKDLVTGEVRCVSSSHAGVIGNGFSNEGSISGDGRLVAFISGATNLAPVPVSNDPAGDNNGIADVFVKSLDGGGVINLTQNVFSGTHSAPQLTADGSSVAFVSTASTGLLDSTPDNNGVADAFLARFDSGGNQGVIFQLVSTSTAGVQANAAVESVLAVSADGRYVVFSTAADNLVAGDTNGAVDVFRKDTLSGETLRVSVGAGGAQGNGYSVGLSVSGDGRYVVFLSLAENLVETDGNGVYDSFVKDMATGAIARLGVQSGATISADGGTIALASNDNQGLAGDSGADADVYVMANPLAPTLTLAGGAGHDTYWVRGAGDLVVEGAGAGVDTVRTAISYALTANVEHLELLGSAHLDGTGNSLANTITGNAGDNVIDGGSGSDTASYATAATAVGVALGEDGPQDTGAGLDTLLSIENLIGSAHDDVLLGDAGANLLDGGAGDDLLAGGLGNDTYGVDSSSDELIEEAGTDTVRSNVTWTLATGFENLTLVGSANLRGTGNAANNVITGNAGSNRLDGGAGIDTVSYAGSRVGVVVSLDRTLQATRAGNDTLLNFENATGGSFNDTLHGTAGGNVLDGAAGIDTVSYARAAAGVAVNLSLTTTQATGGAGSDRVLNFEHLVGSGFNDSLTGSSGNNTLDGGAGNDGMAGGLGNDSYVVDSTGDTVSEAAGEGTDTVLASVNWTLGADVERLTLTGTANIAGTGNTLANTLVGNSGANVLNGGSGGDMVSYADASAAVNANLTTGSVSGGAGADTLISIEHLTGSQHNDTLAGSAGNNILIGGAGSDRITTGSGSDTIVLNSLVGQDTVTDYAVGVDILRILQSTLPLGNGDTGRAGLVTPFPNQASPDHEFVIVSADIAGAITAQNTSATIGTATAPWLPGDTALFIVDNGSDSAVWYFRSIDGDAVVDTVELQLLATLLGSTGLGLNDIEFAA